MIIDRILHLGFIVTVFLNLYTIAEEDSITDSKCQFGKTLRKQVNPEPLNGTCLRDIVVRLSNEFRSITDSELGLKSFEKLLNEMEFVNVSRSLNSKLNLLVDKLNKKLSSYAELLKQSYHVVEPILTKNEDQFIYSGSLSGLDIISNGLSDFCSQIAQGIEFNYLMFLSVCYMFIYIFQHWQLI